MRKLRIFADGACTDAEKEATAGGYGFILVYGNAVKEVSGGELNTTNSRMNVKALAEAFRALKRKGLEADVFLDNPYIVDSLRKKWYKKWIKKGWITATKQPVKHRDIWKEIVDLIEGQDFHYYLTRNHVNVTDPESLETYYEIFIKNNGAVFSLDEFIYITEMNNRVNELSRIGMEPYKELLPDEEPEPDQLPEIPSL